MIKPGKWDGDDFLGFAFIAFILAIVGLAVWMAVMAIRADGRVDYCYVEQNTFEYAVMGHRKWASDSRLATELTAEAAQAKLLTMCPGGKP